MHEIYIEFHFKLCYFLGYVNLIGNVDHVKLHINIVQCLKIIFQRIKRYSNDFKTIVFQADLLRSSKFSCMCISLFTNWFNTLQELVSWCMRITCFFKYCKLWFLCCMLNILVINVFREDNDHKRINEYWLLYKRTYLSASIYSNQAKWEKAETFMSKTHRSDNVIFVKSVIWYLHRWHCSKVCQYDLRKNEIFHIVICPSNDSFFLTMFHLLPDSYRDSHLKQYKCNRWGQNCLKEYIFFLFYICH